MKIQTDACSFWPKARVEASYYEPVTSAIPTLVLSGQIDPVTPPMWGEQVAANLSHSKHVIIPGAGHTAGATGCGLRIIKNFIAKGSPEGLDTSCADRAQRPPFFLTPAGPDPSFAHGTPRAPEGKP